MATPRTITIEMPLCFFSDDHGPIHKIQVIVSEPAGTFICKTSKKNMHRDRKALKALKIHFSTFLLNIIHFL